MKLFITTLLASFAATAQASLSDDWSLTLTSADNNGNEIDFTYGTMDSNSRFQAQFFTKECTTAIDPGATGLSGNIENMSQAASGSGYEYLYVLFVDPSLVSQSTIFSGDNKVEFCVRTSVGYNDRTC